jgi:DNA-binding Lrp family transcriptional regulator
MVVRDVVDRHVRDDTAHLEHARLRLSGSGCPHSMGVPRTREVSVVQAYILIQTEVGKAAQVAKEVRDIAGVAEAEDVTGPYDVIVRAEAKNVDELGKLVVAKIQGVEGITRTLTCPVVHL